MNRHLYTTDEFGRSADPGSSRYAISELFAGRRPHISAYERYFEGYRAIRVPRRNGRGTKTIRVYEGTRYHPVLTQKQQKNRRLSYAVLFSLAIIAYLLALMLPVTSNSVWYVVLGALVFGVFLGRFLLALNLYLFARKDLTVHEYRDGACKLVKIAGYTDRIVLIPVIATGIFFVLESGSFSRVEMVRLFLMIVSSGVIRQIGKLEGKVFYTVISSTEKKMVAFSNE